MNEEVGRREAGGGRRRAVAAGIFLALWGYALRHAAPSVTVGDSGEFITAAATLSLAHSPSYPLFALAGKAFSEAVPWGHAGYVVNIFSAALNVLSAVLVFLVSRRLFKASFAGAFFAAAATAGTPAFFHNGLVTEVFALNTALALAVLAALSRDDDRAPILAGFLGGMGVGNHHTLVLLGPAALGLIWKRLSARTLAGTTAAFLLGFSVYAFLPLRSFREPPLDWGDPESAAGLFRTITRQDYGSFSLALGETPPRTLAAAGSQIGRFLAAYADQWSPAGILLVLVGFWLLWKRSSRLALFAAAGWFVSGPFFIWLGNLPFDAQSDGVLQRFYILPVLFGAFALAQAWDWSVSKSRLAAPALVLLPAFLLWRSGREFPLRGDFLTQDYSVNIMRSLPPNAALFMDGGDDTFYSMAFQRFVREKRGDLNLFDRGGLIFRSAYGPDFRRLTREEKPARRMETERAWLSRGPLYYSTMDEGLLPGVPLAQRGFLYRAADPGGKEDPWSAYAFRSLYPPPSNDYRVRALAPFFPFMKARAFAERGEHGAALRHWERALAVGEDVPWLRANVGADASRFAFQRMAAEDWTGAESFYALCLRVDPGRPDALTNLGVACEKQGKREEAARWYEKALAADPDNVNALYNLAVVHWHRQDWDRVIPLLEKVVRLNPAHHAAGFLARAREKVRR